MDTTQDRIQRGILVGLVAGTRVRGRQRATWTDNIKTWTG